MLLVHRLEDPAPERVARSVPCTSNVMTGITSASQPSCSMESFEELLRTGTAHAEYSGKVGDCCDEEVVSQVWHFLFLIFCYVTRKDACAAVESLCRR